MKKIQTSSQAMTSIGDPSFDPHLYITAPTGIPQNYHFTDSVDSSRSRVQWTQ